MWNFDSIARIWQHPPLLPAPLPYTVPTIWVSEQALVRSVVREAPEVSLEPCPAVRKPEPATRTSTGTRLGARTRYQIGKTLVSTMHRT